MKHWGKIVPFQVEFYLAASLAFSTVIATAGEVAVPTPQGSASPGAAAGAKVLKLEEAVVIAVDNHPRIRAAKEKVGAQNAVLGQQMSAYYPTVSLSNSYRTTTSSGTTTTSQEAFDLFSSRANFDMTLYNFGKREGSVQSARETLDAVGYTYRTTVEEVVLAVKQAYFSYLQARALVRVREETVKGRELIVRQARGVFEVGTRPKIDVARAESNLYNAQADLIALCSHAWEYYSTDQNQAVIYLSLREANTPEGELLLFKAKQLILPWFGANTQKILRAFASQLSLWPPLLACVPEGTTLQTQASLLAYSPAHLQMENPFHARKI